MIPAGELKNPETTGWRPSSLWPSKLLGRRPGLKEINLLCWGLFVAFLLVPSSVVFVLQAVRGTQTIQRHADFVFYYGVGTIANHYPPAKIYDPALQRQVFTRINPHPYGAYGDCPYPPPVPYIFSLFARLPFNVAYFLWMLVSFTLYCTGISFMAWTVIPGEKLKIALVYCFAIGCYPCFASTLVNGQISAFAVFAVGLALYLENIGYTLYSGMALALLAYKPPLLLVILPMLLLTRRFKTIAGFVIGTCLLFLVGTTLGGIQIWPAWIRLMRYHSQLAGLQGQAAIKLPIFVDFSSLTHLLPDGRTPAVLSLIVTLAAISAALLAISLWRTANRDRPIQRLAWAATLTWTLLLNIYVPVYDSVLVVIAILLMLGALRDLHWDIALEWTILLALVLFAVSWKTVSFAEAHRIQLMTLVLFVLGCAQLFFLHRAMQRSSASAVPPSA